MRCYRYEIIDCARMVYVAKYIYIRKHVKCESMENVTLNI